MAFGRSLIFEARTIGKVSTAGEACTEAEQILLHDLHLRGDGQSLNITLSAELITAMRPILNEPNDLPAAVPVISPPVPHKSLAIRELSKLIADIRLARAQFQRCDQKSREVSLETVVGADPRD